MKKRKLRKMMAALFCIIMILSISACTATQNRGKDSETKNSDTYKSKETEQVSQTKEEENKEAEEQKEIEEKKEPKEGVEIIKLFTDDLFSSCLKEAVKHFNEENEKYQIEVTGCSGRRRNEDGVLREPEDVLQIEIEAQGEPDILFWSGGSMMRQYARQGIFADLYPFLTQEEEPPEKIYDKKILKASMIDGKLYQLPYKFDLKMLLGNKKMMGDMETWTMEEMLSFYQKLPKTFMYMMDISKEHYIWDIFCYQQSDYIDHDTGKFHVQTEDFINILKFAKYLPDWEADIGCSGKWSLEKMIPQGQLLLTRMSIWAESSIKYYEKIYKKAGGCNILSYPSVKNDGILADVTMFPFAILKSSKYKEKAWELLRFAENYALSEELKNVKKMSRFSTKKEILKKQLHTYKKENRKKIKELLKRVGRIRTDYDLETYLQYSIYGWGSFNEKDDAEEIISIITRNAKKYFDGKETVEKSVEKIQKKLDKYYQKRKKEAAMSWQGQKKG